MKFQKKNREISADIIFERSQLPTPMYNSRNAVHLVASIVFLGGVRAVRWTKHLWLQTAVSRHQRDYTMLSHIISHCRTSMWTHIATFHRLIVANVAHGLRYAYRSASIVFSSGAVHRTKYRSTVNRVFAPQNFKLLQTHHVMISDTSHVMSCTQCYQRCFGVSPFARESGQKQLFANRNAQTALSVQQRLRVHRPTMFNKSTIYCHVMVSFVGQSICALRGFSQSCDDQRMCCEKKTVVQRILWLMSQRGWISLRAVVSHSQTGPHHTHIVSFCVIELEYLWMTQQCWL